jgi:putative transcriptional regulator
MVSSQLDTLEEMIVSRLREWREARDLTQQELGRRVQVSRQSINALETGKYRPTTVLALKLSDVLGVRVEDLFALEPGDWQ